MTRFVTPAWLPILLDWLGVFGSSFTVAGSLGGSSFGRGARLGGFPIFPVAYNGDLERRRNFGHEAYGEAVHTQVTNGRIQLDPATIDLKAHGSRQLFGNVAAGYRAVEAVILTSVGRSRCRLWLQAKVLYSHEALFVPSQGN